MSDTAEKPKSKRQLRDEVIAVLKAKSGRPIFHQRCPYTVCTITGVYGSKTYRGVGFSKVCWPDPFLPEKGKEFAKTRAYKDIANQILREQNAV